MACVDVERQGASGIIRFTNPPMGVINTPQSEEMLTVFRALSSDPTVQTIIFTGGQPGIFIRHWDVSEYIALMDAAEAGLPPPDLGGTPNQAIMALIDEVPNAPQPVIAAINGMCMGAGFELALACDLRIADPKAQSIGAVECRVGAHPAAGAVSRLPRIVGEAAALNIVLRGLIFSGQEAYDIGLVTELADDPIARALEIAGVWETRVGVGLANAKRLIRSALDRPVAAGLIDERRSHDEIVQQSAELRQNLRRVLPPGDIRDL